MIENMKSVIGSNTRGDVKMFENIKIMRRRVSVRQTRRCWSGAALDC